MSMSDFPNLLEQLLLNSSKKIKINLLNDFFKSVSLSDRGWALSILSDSIKKKNLTLGDLKILIKQKIAPELFDLSYDYVGDLAETISLLWPKNDSTFTKFDLSKFMENTFSIKEKSLITKEIEKKFNNSNSLQIYTIIKIITGGLRVGVSTGLIRESLVRYGKRSSNEIEEVWHGFTSPYFDFFIWLEGGDLPKHFEKKNLFNSFMLSKPIDKNIFRKNTKDFIAEYKWDGIRAQILTSSNFRIFSRNSEDITESFPDLKFFSSQHHVIDGELLIKKNSEILSFNLLQKRLRRKRVTSSILNELPAYFIAYDIIYCKGKKCADLSLEKRKELLKDFIFNLNKNNISFSPLIKFSSWKELEELKSKSHNNHIEGLMIKKLASKYEKGRSNNWFKWKRQPFTIDFVIMYAQRGHGKRSSFYSDFTFGCWIDKNFGELVPIGKAYSGFSNDELNELDKWVRNNTVQKFGPVRSVKPSLVVEIAFDNINFSSRHKSGVALRFPRFSRIRWDKPPNEVCILKDVRNLIN